jgi:hypothetical protein
MVEKADSGEFVTGNSYKLRHSKSGFSICVQPLFVENCDVAKGDEADTYLDLSRGIVVYDFGGTLRGDGE